jgi:hypothetical protein
MNLRARNVSESDQPSVLKMVVQSQEKMELSISRLANTVTEFVVESKHVRKDVDDLRSDIHGKGQTNDRIHALEVASTVESGKKKLISSWVKPIASFISGALLVVLGYYLSR